MKRSAPAAILLATGLIAGCSTSEPLNQKADFQSMVQAKSEAASLEVPPDLTTPQTQNKYAIPTSGTATASQLARDQKAAPATGTPSNTTPSAVVASVNKVKMERAGTQRWLEISDKTPAQLWPLLKAFFQDSGFTIKTEEPDIGVMETDWAENRAKLPNDGIRSMMEYVGLGNVYSTAERDMFRIRLEKGVNGGTEVYFSHRGVEEIYVTEGKSETKWQPRPVDPELEAEMLGRFMTRLGVTNEQARTAIKQTQAPAAEQAAPITNGTLTINDTFDRAWRRVGLALDRVGLVVSDRDRSQGIYFVKPAQNDVEKMEAAKSSGFWSSMAFWRSNDKSAAAPLDDSLRIQIKETTPGSTTITLTDKQGQVVNSKAATTALGKLQHELQ
jgi:outer membrane protein assembly factor BamC